MRKVGFLVSGAFIILIFATTSYAGNGSVGIKAGTLGIGPELGYSFNNSFDIRAGFNYFSINRSSNEGDIDYDLKAKLRNFSLLLDWHPFKGKFRITTGLLYNKNKLEGNGKASGGTFTIGNKTYSISDIASVYGKIEYKDLNPYLGFGWDTTAGKDRGFGITFDLGAIYQGNSKVTIISSGNTAIINSAEFQNNLNIETGKVKHDADKLKVWPVVSLGLVYRF